MEVHPNLIRLPLIDNQIVSFARTVSQREDQMPLNTKSLLLISFEPKAYPSLSLSISTENWRKTRRKHSQAVIFVKKMNEEVILALLKSSVGKDHKILAEALQQEKCLEFSHRPLKPSELMLLCDLLKTNTSVETLKLSGLKF